MGRELRTAGGNVAWNFALLRCEHIELFIIVLLSLSSPATPSFAIPSFFSAAFLHSLALSVLTPSHPRFTLRPPPLFSLTPHPHYPLIPLVPLCPHPPSPLTHPSRPPSLLATPISQSLSHP